MAPSCVMLGWRVLSRRGSVVRACEHHCSLGVCGALTLMATRTAPSSDMMGDAVRVYWRTRGGAGTRSNGSKQALSMTTLLHRYPQCKLRTRSIH